MRLSIVILLTLLILMTLFSNLARAEVLQPKWPEIQPTQIKTFVTFDNAKVVLYVFSKEDPSKKLYVLRCNRGDSNEMDEELGEDDYYGMFQCHLLPLTGRSIAELLIGEDWSFGKSYNTRGVFKYEQLIGPCKNNPEFGVHREFNMRGMKLELTVTNFSSPPIADMISGKVQPYFSFTFEAKVTLNNSATAEYTSPSARKYCGGYYELDGRGNAVYHESAN